MGSDGPNMQAALLAQLEQQLAAANARVAELESQLTKSNDQCLKTMFRNAELESTLAACREAGFVTGKGEVRKVLGTLPVLASGEIVVSQGEAVFAIDANRGVMACDVDITGDRATAGWMRADTHHNIWTEYDIGDCFSTREAAEAARGGQK